jgi:16S rRNA (cytidine1402-2'-O)-methyltransferase
MKGKLYLIPVGLGETVISQVLPAKISGLLSVLKNFVVENEKTARRNIRSINPDVDQNSIQISILNKHTEDRELIELIKPCLEGKDVGLMSEAGVPAVADPGSRLVRLAHHKGIKVIPLVGPSSIILALMGSGLNGQDFAFSGYLPLDSRERKKAINQLENKALREGQTQIFIETPYRNDKLIKELVSSLSADTILCVACDLTLDSELILSMTVSQWRKHKSTLNKRPAVFLIGS